MPCLSPGLLISRAQMLMFPLRKTWTRNRVKLVCLKNICVPDVYVLRNTVCRRSGVCEGSVRMWCRVPWGSWIPPEGAELCAAGSCVGSGSQGQQELCEKSCTLTNLCSSGNGLALYSCNIRDNPKLYLLYVCVVFSLVRRVI